MIAASYHMHPVDTHGRLSPPPPPVILYDCLMHPIRLHCAMAQKWPLLSVIALLTAYHTPLCLNPPTFVLDHCSNTHSCHRDCLGIQRVTSSPIVMYGTHSLTEVLQIVGHRRTGPQPGGRRNRWAKLAIRKSTTFQPAF